MNILGLDPGPTESAVVLYAPGQPGHLSWATTKRNAEWHSFFLDQVQSEPVLVALGWQATLPTLVIEYMRPRGLPTSQAEMDTMFELGRIVQTWGGPVEKIGRQDATLALTGRRSANDTMVRRALIDRWGGDAAIKGPQKCKLCGGKGWRGNKREPCPNVRVKWEGLLPPENIPCEGNLPAGPLHGIKGDEWSALAIAVAWAELHAEE